MFVIKKYFLIIDTYIVTFEVDIKSMHANELIIQIIITDKDVDERTTNNCCVVKGIENLNTIIRRLKFDGKESVIVHLNESIDRMAADILLGTWCDKLVDSGHVLYARHLMSGIPECGSKYHTVFDANYKLIENRYMVIYKRA